MDEAKDKHLPMSPPIQGFSLFVQEKELKADDICITLSTETKQAQADLIDGDNDCSCG